MDETHRMLGKEHEADLEREAEKWRRAAEFRAQRRRGVPVPRIQARWKPGGFSAARLIAFLARVARAES
jgi:hypothetical protein